MANNQSKFSHIYAGNPLDRGDRERRDENWLRERAKDPTSKFLPLSNLEALLSNGPDPGLGWLSREELDQLRVDASSIFLGIRGGDAYFAVDLSHNGYAINYLDKDDKWRFENTQAAADYLSQGDLGILAQARIQINWHNLNQFCSICGHETYIKRGGQIRQCLQCHNEHFPRTDPVVIALVSDKDRCLLGQSRGRHYGEKRYSALAGFVDQGESIEEAVAREIREEAGIKVKNVRYHSSQPWPFPWSLMIGCHAEAETTEIEMDDDEMADVRWFSRGEVLLALQGESKILELPGPIAIANHLIEAWATR